MHDDVICDIPACHSTPSPLSPRKQVVGVGVCLLTRLMSFSSSIAYAQSGGPRRRSFVSPHWAARMLSARSHLIDIHVSVHVHDDKHMLYVETIYSTKAVFIRAQRGYSIPASMGILLAYARRIMCHMSARNTYAIVYDWGRRYMSLRLTSIIDETRPSPCEYGTRVQTRSCSRRVHASKDMPGAHVRRARS